MEKIKSLLKNNTYERNAIVVFIISVITGGTNYLFQIITGRLFEPESFGQISVLISFLGIYTAIGGSLMKSVAVKTAATEKGKLNGILSGTIKKSFIYLPVIYLLLSAVTYIINGSLLVTLFFFISSVFISVSFIYEGVLQGSGNVIQAQFCEFISAFCKLTFLVLFLYLGMGGVAVPINTILMNIIIFIFAYIYVKKKGILGEDVKLKKNTREMYSKDVKDIYKHYISSLCSTLSLAFFNAFDVLAVKMFFDETTVGQYSAVSLFGKMILYIPQALVLVMLPSVASSSDGESIKTLKKSIIYSVSLSSLASVALFIIKKPLVLLLLGESYLPCLQYFIPSSVMMLSIVAFTLLMNYELAKSDKNFLSFFSIVSVFIVVLAAYASHSIFGTVDACLYGMAVAFVILSFVLIVRIFGEYRKKRKELKVNK